MINFDENNLENNSSGSLENDESYRNVLNELGMGNYITDSPVRLHANRFGKFSIVCNTTKQTNEVKTKLGIKGFIPLYPGTLVARDKEGKVKYILMYDIKSKMPQICLN